MMPNIAHGLTWRYFMAMRLICPAAAGHRATAPAGAVSRGQKMI